MEDRCEFIWQIIKENQVLNEKMHELECQNSNDCEKQVKDYIQLFREIDEVMECIVETYHSTRILTTTQT